MLQKALDEMGHLDTHQRSGWRQTEYQRPRFSSRQCGSEQSFLRIAADAVGSEGGGGVAGPEHAANAPIASARIPGLTNAFSSTAAKGAAITVVRGRKPDSV